MHDIIYTYIIGFGNIGMHDIIYTYIIGFGNIETDMFEPPMGQGQPVENCFLFYTNRDLILECPHIMGP